MPVDPITAAVLSFATKEGGKAAIGALGKVGEDPTEEQKSCRVCGIYIKGGAKFHFGKRFYCARCGHRTHKSCAGDRSQEICRACL